MDTGRQRVDRFLWHARLVRTRASAAKLATSGKVRINGQRVAVAGRGLKIGDVLTITGLRRVRVVKVRGFTARRGGNAVARSLYEDFGPAMVADEKRMGR